MKQTRKQGRGIVRSSLLNPEACRPTGDVEHDHATPAFRLYLLTGPLFLPYLSRRQAGRQAAESAGRPAAPSLLRQCDLLYSISADERSKASVTFTSACRCVHVRARAAEKKRIACRATSTNTRGSSSREIEKGTYFSGEGEELSRGFNGGNVMREFSPLSIRERFAQRIPPTSRSDSNVRRVTSKF